MHAQPALFIAGLAAVEKLRSEGPAGAAAVASASACAGLSLGEYCALVFAGALPFEDALRVVKARAEAMAAVAQAGPHGRHGMLSVVGLEDAKLEALCSAARAAGPPGTVCAVANYLFPQGRVVSGDKAALEEARTSARARASERGASDAPRRRPDPCARVSSPPTHPLPHPKPVSPQVLRGATAAGALKAQLVAVSGAFHTSRMDAAAAALKAATAGAAFSQPRIPVYSNVTGEPFPVPPGGGAAAAAAAIAPLLARQLTEPVRWEGTLGALLKAGKTELYELGVGAQVKAMVKRVDNAAWKAMKTVAA